VSATEVGSSSDAAGAAPSRAPFEGPVRHVYVHVPFCRARCDYCDFASTPVAAGAGGRAGAETARRLDEYVEALAAEWERERAAHDVRRLHTLYLGGGTPSLLGPDRLECLLELFWPQLTPRAEVTVETNPEDADDEYAAWAATAPLGTASSRGAAGRGQTTGGRGPAAKRGVRVSLGAQSFSPELRAVLGRTAQADPAAAFRRLRASGVDNAGLDLIHGIPGQTPELLAGDIAAALELRPDHISWYELDVIEGTALAARLSSGLDPDAMPADPRDDVRAAGYRRVVRELTRAGYDWYEVSNFALPGRRARHNVAYWRARPYLGLGPGAVSTVGAQRWTNAADPASWAAALAAGEEPPRVLETLDSETRARERVLLAARCGARVPLAEVAAVIDPGVTRGLAAAGLVSLHSGTIRVTRKGRHVADEVCVRLFRAPHLRG
jgi:oxygen-independent coproporphyrinogen III oxidase